ncbi:hypothetical protein WH43_18365 [Rheinheimera sp. KL1]|uniref:hypothetical protein n=1 Tax=Rheinheimera sp. KL1 TaxID=1635005 RepID=UPI0006A99FC8|nr:hypothetical protein [Rheinheimera sp. KL1]KOO56759.1 hypothetical protein WH43_18365 [Rheinheimera sp. KL1]
MSNCEKYKKDLESWKAFETLSGLIFHGSDGLPCDGEGIYQESVLHVQTCKSCRSWLEEKISSETHSRLTKLKQYCCPVMFVAVEENEIDQLKVGLMSFQGESTWAVMNFNTVGGNLLLCYCPWCGKKLPNSPFITEEKGC